MGTRLRRFLGVAQEGNNEWASGYGYIFLGMVYPRTLYLSAEGVYQLYHRPKDLLHPAVGHIKT